MKINTILSNILLVSGIFASNIADSYDLGLKAYESGQYNLAIQEFEKIIDAGWESEQLYYNLGNAYYREDNIPGAVWALEKCLMLNPRHQDAQFNLSLVNIKVKDRVDIPDPPVYLKYYRQMKLYLRPDQWILLISIFFLAIAFLRMIRKIREIGDDNAFMTVENSIRAALTMILLVGLNAIYDDYSKREGIIYQDQVTATSEPNEYSTNLFIVHDGLKVSILDTKDDWSEIELIDGKSGWIPQSSIRNL